MQARLQVGAQAAAHSAAEVIARALPDPFWWRHRKPLAAFGRVSKKALGWVLRRRRKARKKLARLNTARAAGQLAAEVGGVHVVFACALNCVPPRFSVVVCTDDVESSPRRESSGGGVDG